LEDLYAVDRQRRGRERHFAMDTVGFPGRGTMSHPTDGQVGPKRFVVVEEANARAFRVNAGVQSVQR
jgi:hypothetical protein